MAQSDPIAFTRLADGTLLQRHADGAFRPVESRSDRGRLATLSAADIEAMSTSDPDHPALDGDFWSGVGDPAPGKEAISIKLDRDVLGFFRQEGRGYQTRISAVLRSYMQARKRTG